MAPCNATAVVVREAWQLCTALTLAGPQALHVPPCSPKSAICHCHACLLSNFISPKHLVRICHCPPSPWTHYLTATWSSTTASMAILNISIKPTKITPNSAREKCAPAKHSMYVTPPYLESSETPPSTDSSAEIHFLPPNHCFRCNLAVLMGGSVCLFPSWIAQWRPCT